MIERLHQGPLEQNEEQKTAASSSTRWQLKHLRDALPWLEGLSISGVHRLLSRFGIGLKRGRDYIHSPDPHYAEKLSEVARSLERAAPRGGGSGREVTLYEDEFSFYRQPVVACDYCEKGSANQPLARRSYRSNTVAREAAVINPRSGEVIHRQASIFNVPQILKFYRQVVEAYPAKRINLIQDNWPVHFHPALLACLEPQKTSFELRVLPAWKSEKTLEMSRRRRESLKRAGQLLPIQIVPLPIYASWTNPTEKLWRKIRQEYLHMHRKADQWGELKQGAKEYLDQFRHGSQQVLRYLGLAQEERRHLRTSVNTRGSP